MLGMGLVVVVEELGLMVVGGAGNNELSCFTNVPLFFTRILHGTSC